MSLDTNTEPMREEEEEGRRTSSLRGFYIPMKYPVRMNGVESFEQRAEVITHIAG